MTIETTPKEAVITVFDRKHARLLEEAQKKYIQSLSSSDTRREVAVEDLRNLPKHVDGLVDRHQYSSELPKIVFNTLNDNLLEQRERLEDLTEDLEVDELTLEEAHQLKAEKAEIEQSISALEKSAQKLEILFGVKKLPPSKEFVSVLRATQQLKDQPLYNSVDFFEQILSTQNICDNDKKEYLASYAKYLCDEMESVPSDFSSILKVVKTSDEDIDKKPFFDILSNSEIFREQLPIDKSVSAKAESSIGETLRELVLETCDLAIRNATSHQKSLEDFLNNYEGTGDPFHDRSDTENEFIESRLIIDILEDLNTIRQKLEQCDVNAYGDDNVKLFRKLLRTFDQCDIDDNKSVYNLCSDLKPFSMSHESSPGSVILEKLVQNEFKLPKELQDELICVYIDVVGEDRLLKGFSSTTGLDILSELDKPYTRDLLTRILDKVETGDQLGYFSRQPPLIKALLWLEPSIFDHYFNKYCDIYSKNQNALSQWIRGDEVRLLECFGLGDNSLIDRVEQLKERRFNTENLAKLLDNFTLIKGVSRVEMYRQLLDDELLKEVMKTYVDLSTADEITQVDLQNAVKQMRKNRER